MNSDTMTTPTAPWRTLVWAAVGLMVGLMVASLLSVPVIVAQIRSTQVDAVKQADDRDEAVAILRDCVEVGGKCFRRTERRDARQDRVAIIAATCANRIPNPTVEAVEACVDEELARRRR